MNTNDTIKTAVAAISNEDLAAWIANGDRDVLVIEKDGTSYVRGASYSDDGDELATMRGEEFDPEWWGVEGGEDECEDLELQFDDEGISPDFIDHIVEKLRLNAEERKQYEDLCNC